MSTMSPTRVIKKLTAAEGFLELGMPDHAARELDAIEHAGPFEAARQFLTGQTFKARERYSDAVESLHRATELLPVAQSRPVWVSLSECYRKSGYQELARAAEHNAQIAQQAANQAANQAVKGVVPVSYVVEISIHRV